MDPLIIVVAFAFGLLARACSLPPLVGFLLAGFALTALGIEGGQMLEDLTELGVQLLLFTIGLKVRPASLLRSQIWLTATAHMIVVVGICTGLIALLPAFGLQFLGIDRTTSVLIAFALSFSSTVFAVKVFEERNEMGTLHAQIAIGVLIMQDLFAVLFLTASSGKVPSAWAALLLLLPLARPLLLRLMKSVGHGELQILLGVLLTIGSAAVFEALKVKPDLGPLVIGLIASGHTKSKEMANSLLGLKDLILTGFFVSIGLLGLPSISQLGLAMLLVLLVPIKGFLFFWLFALLKLRARTSFFASLSLANFSEFGLIVATVGAGAGWLSPDWLVTLAIAASVSFALAAPLNSRMGRLYADYEGSLDRFELSDRVPEEEPVDVGEPRFIVVGMGRIGTGAYDHLREHYGDSVLGIDHNLDVIEKHDGTGRNVIRGSVTDPHFWEDLRTPDSVETVLLAVPEARDAALSAQALRREGYTGGIAATAKFRDELQVLADAGVGLAFDFYADAGAGLAERVVLSREGEGSQAA